MKGRVHENVLNIHINLARPKQHLHTFLRPPLTGGHQWRHHFKRRLIHVNSLVVHELAQNTRHSKLARQVHRRLAVLVADVDPQVRRHQNRQRRRLLLRNDRSHERRVSIHIAPVRIIVLVLHHRRHHIIPSLHHHLVQCRLPALIRVHRLERRMLQEQQRQLLLTLVDCKHERSCPTRIHRIHVHIRFRAERLNNLRLRCLNRLVQRRVSCPITKTQVHAGTLGQERNNLWFSVLDCQQERCLSLVVLRVRVPLALVQEVRQCLHVPVHRRPVEIRLLVMRVQHFEVLVDVLEHPQEQVVSLELEGCEHCAFAVNTAPHEHLDHWAAARRSRAVRNCRFCTDWGDFRVTLHQPRENFLGAEKCGDVDEARAAAEVIGHPADGAWDVHVNVELLHRVELVKLGHVVVPDEVDNLLGVHAHRK